MQNSCYNKNRTRRLTRVYVFIKEYFRVKVVIVGGVAGGASAATRLRRLDESAEIIIFERSGYVSYANCGLPYYIGDVIEDKDELTLQTPQSFLRRFNVVVKIRHEVTAVDLENKTITAVNLETGETVKENFDKLILSPGATPVLPDFFVPNERTFCLRTVEDTYKIKNFLSVAHPKSAIIVGGGFIGIEMAENLKRLGLDVTIIQRSNHLLPTLDCDLASFVHAKIRSKGVRLLLNSTIECATPLADGVSVQLADGRNLRTEMLMVCVGVTPENALAKSAGLELGKKGAIKVNAQMQTSSPDVYAVGDAVETKNFVTSLDDVIPLAGPANKQGRLVADVICGLGGEYNGSQGSSIIKIFDLTVATTGINERQAKECGIDYEKIILTQNSHAGYYPNATAMTLKLIFERKTNKILGAQIVGYDGVDKRIDVIATAMRAGLKADELKNLDLAYAPPYSSAKDPVNMAGFVAENVILGIVKQFCYDDVPTLHTRNDVILLDTRTPSEYARGHAQGFVNIPLDDLRMRLGELDKNKKVYVMCQSGLRSYFATRILMQHGFDAFNFVGGYRLYTSIKNEELQSSSCFECGADK